MFADLEGSPVASGDMTATAEAAVASAAVGALVERTEPSRMTRMAVSAPHTLGGPAEPPVLSVLHAAQLAPPRQQRCFVASMMHTW